MAQDFIVDPETRKVVAIIRNGEVFRDEEGARIAVFVGANLYDLEGNLLGSLDAGARPLPIAFRRLLELETNRRPTYRRPAASRQAPAPSLSAG